MTHSILTNRAKHLLILRLNSGATIHLAPNESTPPLDQLEIAGNRKIDDLIAQHRLATGAGEAGDSVEPTDSGDAPGSEKRAGKGRAKR
jgi:hypothetical protein